jgi:uncharacterized PurR-regulated membrane protein YhhQ (DUF165 family)
MDPEMAAFFRRIGYTILVALIWLAINATAAIKGDNAFIGDHVTLGNVLFYVWFIVSVILLILIYKKMWYK